MFAQDCMHTQDRPSISKLSPLAKLESVWKQALKDKEEDKLCLTHTHTHQAPLQMSVMCVCVCVYIYMIDR